MCWTILLTAWISMHIGFRLSTSSTYCGTKVFSHLWFFVYGMWLFLGRQEQTSTHPSSNRLRKDNTKVQFGKSMCFIGIISRNIDEWSHTRTEMTQRQMHQISIPVCGIVPESWKRWSIMYHTACKRSTVCGILSRWFLFQRGQQASSFPGSFLDLFLPDDLI